MKFGQMEVEVRDKVLEMLKSGDHEMMDLAVVLFCYERPTFMEYFFIERSVKYDQFYYSDVMKLYLAKMSKCVR